MTTKRSSEENNDLINKFKLHDGTIDYDALRKKIIDSIPSLIDKVCTDHSKEDKNTLNNYLEDNIFKINQMIFDEMDDHWLEELKTYVSVLEKEYNKRYK